MSRRVRKKNAVRTRPPRFGPFSQTSDFCALRIKLNYVKSIVKSFGQRTGARLR